MFSSINRVANPRRAWYRGMLLSLVLLWCMALGSFPASAAAHPSVQPLSDCACCGTASGASDCVSVCNAPQHVVAKDLGLLPSIPVPAAGAHHALVEWKTVATSLHSPRTLLAGPPLYLKLHRFLN